MDPLVFYYEIEHYSSFCSWDRFKKCQLNSIGTYLTESFQLLPRPHSILNLIVVCI